MAQSKKHINQLAQALSPSTYPWRDNNSLELLINGQQFFPHMLKSIGTAKHFILLEMYLMESGKIATDFINALLEAAKRGVKVHILLDDFGCRSLSNKDRSRLQASSVNLCFYNPLHYGTFRRNLFRDHRKILIIDNTVAYIGGVGLTDYFIDISEKNLGWRETVVAIQGESIIDWQDAFSRVWNFYSDKALKIENQNPDLPETIVPCRVNCTVGSAQQGIKQSLVKRIRSTERQCWIATAYFVPSFKVRRALARAAKRGVDVRILLPGENTDHPSVRHAGRRFYLRLLKAGVKIYEYQPRFLHQKVLLCDSWVSIGSSNIDRWNFRWNLEANQEVEDQGFVNHVVEMFKADFAESQACILEEWENRSMLSRLQENFWGYIDRLIDRYLR